VYAADYFACSSANHQYLFTILKQWKMMVLASLNGTTEQQPLGEIINGCYLIEIGILRTSH
jgi:hypothetical protein